jgi:hypothetical protein
MSLKGGGSVSVTNVPTTPTVAIPSTPAPVPPPQRVQIDVIAKGGIDVTGSGKVDVVGSGKIDLKDATVSGSVVINGTKIDVYTDRCGRLFYRGVDGQLHPIQ